MSANSPPDYLSKVNHAVDDFIKKHGSKKIKPGTAEWNTAVDEAVEQYQLGQHRQAFAAQLELELAKKLIGCIRDGYHEKCNEGPWYGASCLLCGKKGSKPERPGREIPATR